jgi:hypothetical protein
LDVIYEPPSFFNFGHIREILGLLKKFLDNTKRNSHGTSSSLIIHEFQNKNFDSIPVLKKAFPLECNESQRNAA